MYKLIALLSLYIRNMVLPNPFEQLPEPITISVCNAKIILPATLLNLLAEPILHAITFAVVGIYYSKGLDSPAKGSVLYLLFFCIHVAMLFIMSTFRFSLMAVISTVVIYIVIQVSISIVKNNLSYGL